MIQLATDPNANRRGWMPGARADQEASLQSRRGRPGHAWPFLSKQIEPRPEAQAGARSERTDNAS